MKAFALDPDHCLENELQKAHIKNITLCPAASAEQLYASVGHEPGDLVLLHMEMPGLNGLDVITQLRKQNSNIPAILLTARTPSEQMWLRAASERSVALLQTPITAGKLQYHLARLFEQTAPAERNPNPLQVSPVDELRNERGRLDVRKISAVFDLPVSDIAKCINVPRPTITKTPDSKAIQSELHNFERIARSLLTVTGSIKGLKMWLHAPNPEFEQHTPLEILRLGKLSLLADWLDDARLGTPD